MSWETQKHVKGVFPSDKGDKTTHRIDGIHSKFVITTLTFEALDWCCGDGCKFVKS